MSGSPKFSKDFDGMTYSNVFEVFDICLGLPNDSKKYFGFVIDDFRSFVGSFIHLFIRSTK